MVKELVLHLWFLGWRWEKHSVGLGNYHQVKDMNDEGMIGKIVL
jgi:hypothetical protein